MLAPRDDRPNRTAPPYLPDADDWFALEDWVGADRPSRRDDVAKIEALLAASGDLSFARTQGPTGYWGLTQDAALRRYQKRHGLAPDGALRPGGPTITDMGERYGAMFAGLAPPTADDIDAHHEALARGEAPRLVWNPDEAGGQPLGTKVAATDLVGDGLLAAHLWRSALMAKRAADAAHELSGAPRTPAEDKGFKEEFVPAPIPDPNDTGGFSPVQPEPTNTGHTTPEPVGTEPLVNVPEQVEQEPERILDDIFRELFPTIFPALDYESRTDYRGGKETLEGSNAIARYIRDRAKAAGLADVFEQTGGGSAGGELKKYLKEKIVHLATGKVRRSDLTFELLLGNVKRWMHVNTVTTDSKGNPIPREAAAARDIEGARDVSFFGAYPKKVAGESDEGYVDRILPQLEKHVDAFLDPFLNPPPKP